MFLRKNEEHELLCTKGGKNLSENGASKIVCAIFKLIYHGKIPESLAS